MMDSRSIPSASFESMPPVAPCNPHPMNAWLTSQVMPSDGRTPATPLVKSQTTEFDDVFPSDISAAGSSAMMAAAHAMSLPQPPPAPAPHLQALPPTPPVFQTQLQVDTHVAAGWYPPPPVMPLPYHDPTPTSDWTGFDYFEPTLMSDVMYSTLTGNVLDARPAYAALDPSPNPGQSLIHQQPCTRSRSVSNGPMYLTPRMHPRRHTVSITNGTRLNGPPEALMPDMPPTARFRIPTTSGYRSVGPFETPPSPMAADLLASAHSHGAVSSSVCSPLSAHLETLSHEELLERVMALEQEKRSGVGNAETRPLRDEAQPSYKGSTAHAMPTGTSTTAPLTMRPSPSCDPDDESEDGKEQRCRWDDCLHSFETLEQLVTHTKDDHIGSGKKLYYCQWESCSRREKPFTKRHKMHNHLRTHTGERPFECTKKGCGKRFSRPDSLNIHLKIHSNVRPYCCHHEHCGKAYFHVRSLRKHERSHSASSTAPSMSDLFPPSLHPVGQQFV